MSKASGTTHLVMIGGGVRSGKSRYALARARTIGTRRVFIATAGAHDHEMRERISVHQVERGDAFETIEEPLELVPRLHELAPFDVLVLDCLTLWLSNRLLRDKDAARVKPAIDELTSTLAQLPGTMLIVTNEVGMGVVPPSPLGRTFRDIAGYAHQQLAARCDEVLFAAMGVMLELKPGPVRMVTP